jgi:hypothetical protein
MIVASFDLLAVRRGISNDWLVSGIVNHPDITADGGLIAMTDDSGKSEGAALSENQNPSDTTSAVIQSLFTNLKDNTDLAALERTLNLAKLHSEIQKLDSEKRQADEDAKKAAVDASLAARQLRHSLTSSMLAPLVPPTSLATACDLRFGGGSVTTTRASCRSHVAWSRRERFGAVGDTRKFLQYARRETGHKRGDQKLIRC